MRPFRCIYLNCFNRLNLLLRSSCTTVTGCTSNKYEVTMDRRFQHLTNLPHFEYNVNFSSKSKTVVFAQFLISKISTFNNFKCQLTGTILKKSREQTHRKVQMLILDAKMPHLPHFGHNKDFALSSFLHLLNPKFMQL